MKSEEQLIISIIKKEASLISDLEKLLKLQFDEKLVQQGLKFIDILEKIQSRKESDIITQNEIVEIKEKLKSIMQQVQDIWESLFSIQQRLINEQQLKT
jgi:hypothetical protein